MDDDGLPILEHVSYSTNFEDYEIKDPIGYGSSAIVYLAQYKPLQEDVCIKQIDLDQFERNQIDELRKEIQVMTLCRHPNILPIRASFVNGSKLWIVAPFISAGSCADILKSEYPEGFEETVIATILKQALHALVYLHKNGHIHRDVKAGNLLVSKDGLVHLADFGVSSSLSEGGDRRGVRRTFVGTPCWMAPEVMEQERGYDNKADIWSFGITALELANGQAPFAKYPPMKVLLLTLQNPPPTLDRHQSRHKFSKSFKEMIDSCLQKDPSKRPTAEKLILHPFFKQARKPTYLQDELLATLPQLEERVRTRLRRQTDELAVMKTNRSEWEFVVDGEDLTSTLEKARKQYAEDPDLLAKPNTDTRASSNESLEMVEEAMEIKHPQRIPSQLSSAASSRRPSMASLQSRTQGRFKIDTTLNEDETSVESDMDEGQKKGRFQVKSNDSEINSMLEEKRGRFQVSSNANLAAAAEAANRTYGLNDLHEQINLFLKLSDQQRMIFQELMSQLDSKTFDESVVNSNYDKQVSSLKRENDELKREIERLRQALSRVTM